MRLCRLIYAPSANGFGIVFGPPASLCKELRTGEADPTKGQSRLPIRMRRLRCCGSRVSMHLSRRFLISFSAVLIGASVVRSAVAAQAYVLADAQTGYILEEQ